MNPLGVEAQQFRNIGDLQQKLTQKLSVTEAQLASCQGREGRGVEQSYTGTSNWFHNLIYIYIYICIYICIHIHTAMCIYICIYVCIS